MEEPKFDKTGNKREGTKKAGLLRTVFRYSDMKDMLLMALGTFGCFADGSSTPLIMLVLSRILNKYAVHHSSQLQINKDALTLIYVAVAVGLGAFLEGFCWARTSERQTSSLRKKYLKSVLRQDASFFDKKQDGNSSTYQVISSVSEETLAIQGVLSEKVPNFLTNISTFISSELVALYLCWKLAIVAIPASSLLVIPAVVYGKLMGEIGKKIQATYGVAGEIVEQAFSSIRTVFSYNGENRMKLRFSEALEGGMELGIKQGLLKGLAMGSIGIAFAIWSLQAWYGSILVIEKGAKGGDVFSAGVCIITGGLALGISLVNIKFFTEAAASASVISDLIEQVPKIDPDDQQGKKKPDFRGEFEFKSVDFAYPSRPGNMVLQNFNLRVMAGQTVGLVGGSGCGKSTVISLVERFYDPIHGEILLDGVSLKTVDLKWVRSQIGLVSQEPVLFATSIKENILLGKQGASMEEVINAAKAANAHNFINQLTEAYNTQVGQFGSQLSGGQKQRIAIARALIRNPKILLLDEATSALDSQSEKSVQDALDQASKERTTVIIAHHLSTLCDTNQIVVMQSGKIVESGSHINLLQNEQGPYFKMVQLQKTCTEHDENSTIIEFNDEQAQVIVEVSEEFDQTIRNIEETKGNPSIWSLMQMAAPEWNSVILGCAAAFCFGAVQPIHSFCMGALLSVYFMNDYTKIKTQTKTYSYVFLINALLAFVANVIQHYNFGFVGERLTKRVREKMVAKMMTFEIEWFEEENNTSGVLCSRLAREANLVRSLVCDRLSLLAQVISAAILAILLSLILSWRLAILIISLQPLIIGSFYARGVLMKSMSRKVLKAQNKSSNLASESVGNHKTIAAFSAEEKVMDLFEVMLEDSKRESQRQAWYAGLGLLISQFLTAANAGLIFWYGARLLNQNKITYKHLFQTFFILVTTGRVIAEAGNMTSDLTKGADAVKSVFMILKRRSKMDPDDPNGIKPEKIKGDIELTNIFFAYPSKPKQMILRDLSLNVETGKSVALVGKSGSGKSTIISMITRFYDPIKGLVKIDGIDAKSYNIRALRSHIALVSQEPPLFAGSIRDNISYGKENATEAEIIEAASHANAHEFISCMKDGYETYCGERGLQLSGGQKQRIALARAILKNPSILLLDEATSALDSESESFVQGAIEKMMTGRTSVIVAHRLSTVQNSELIVVIDKGRIAEQGSHHELIAKREKSLYYSFVRIQQNGLQD